MISPNSPTIPGYPRCLGMTGQIMSRQDRQLASVDHGSGLASEAHGTRPSGLRTGNLSKKFSSIKSSQIIYQIAQK